MGTVLRSKFFGIQERLHSSGAALSWFIHPPSRLRTYPRTALQKPTAFAQSRFCVSPRGGTIAEPYHVHPNRQSVTLVLWASFVNIQLFLGAFPPPNRPPSAQTHVFRISPFAPTSPHQATTSPRSLASHLRRRSSLSHPPPASQPVRVRRKSINLQGACS